MLADILNIQGIVATRINRKLVFITKIGKQMHAINYIERV